MEPVTIGTLDESTLLALALSPVGQPVIFGDPKGGVGLLRLDDSGLLEYLPLLPHIQAFGALGGPLTSDRIMGHLVEVLFALIKPYVPANKLLTSSLARAIELESERLL